MKKTIGGLGDFWLPKMIWGLPGTVNWRQIRVCGAVITLVSAFLTTWVVYLPFLVVPLRPIYTVIFHFLFIALVLGSISIPRVAQYHVDRKVILFGRSPSVMREFEDFRLIYAVFFGIFIGAWAAAVYFGFFL